MRTMVYGFAARANACAGACAAWMHHHHHHTSCQRPDTGQSNAVWMARSMGSGSGCGRANGMLAWWWRGPVAGGGSS